MRRVKVDLFGGELGKFIRAIHAERNGNDASRQSENKDHAEIQTNDLPRARADGFHDGDLFFLLSDQRRNDVDHQQGAQQHGKNRHQAQDHHQGVDDVIERMFTCRR